MTSVVALISMLVVLQVPQASVVGTVRDAGTGAPLIGVDVALTDLERRVVTDRSGRYELLEVPPGPQHVSVRRIGYSSQTVHALVPSRGALEVNFSLPVDPIEVSEIAVRSTVPIRGLEPREDASPPDRQISQAAIRVHPMLAEMDGLQALAGGEIVLDPEAPIGVHIRGGRADQTAYVLDGVPVFSPYHAAGVFSAWNPDALSDLKLFSAAPAPSLPDALSGTVSASTRQPGLQMRSQGSISTGQARATVDGPLGDGGYLFSFRTGFPDAFAPRGEPEYIRGETGDHLAKIELPGLGGRIGFLSYGSESELGTGLAPRSDPVTPSVRSGNHFEWRSRSLGTSWIRDFSRVSLRTQVWHASTDAASTWEGLAARLDLVSDREDRGFLVAVEGGGDERVELGIRLSDSRTSYRVVPGVEAEQPFALTSSTPVLSAFGSVTRLPRDDLRLELGTNAGAAAGRGFVGPRARIHWRAAEGLAVWSSYVRSHQFAQSLQNSESLAGYTFPAHLFVGAGHETVPIARGDLGAAGIEWTPHVGLRISAQAFSRAMHGIVQVASLEPGPFSEGAFSSGRGSARGLSLQVSSSSARYGLLANYGWQRVRYQNGSSSYSPAHGTEHLIDTGLVVHTTPTSLIRASASAGLGRHASASAGPFEWEACNLLDRGCEFFGAPLLSGEPGSQELPAYLRVDLGARKHWHVQVRGRDASIALYGTITNVFGRTNVLTEIVDPDTSERRRVHMRPRSPLVIGLDWRF